MKDQKPELGITVVMPKYTKDKYTGDLAHELYHVKTGLELNKIIGFDAYYKLQCNIDYEKSLAFRTLSEYHSWYKAIKDYGDEQCAITMRMRFNGYKYGLTNEISVCDTIAAHCAWSTAHKVVFKDGELSVEEKLFVDCIMQIITSNSSWPISLESFDKIGKDIMQAFKKYIF